MSEEKPLNSTTENTVVSSNQPEAGKRLALVVGVNEAPAIQTLAKLNYAENDAAEMKHVLEQPHCGFEVTFIPPDRASASSIKSAILKLAAQRQDEDFLLFYFSGHGYPVKLDDQRRDVYLVTSDFDEELVRSDATLYFSLSWLWEKLHQSTGAGRVLIILDCCYSGNMLNAGPDPYTINLRDLINDAINKYKKTSTGQRDRHRQILTSSGYNVTAAEQETAKHGFMTDLLLQILRGEVQELIDAQGEISIQTIHRYLETKMGADRQPYLLGNHTRSCVLARKLPYCAPPVVTRQTKLAALFADHSGFIQNRLNSFVGREKELAEIRQQIAEKLETGGYVTITGQAGQGKSSVIAKLVHEYGPTKVAHHFIPFRPGPDHQVNLLRNLMARLIIKHDLSDIYIASESRAALRDYFPKVLADIQTKRQQEVIFVDGLDQLEEEVSGGRDLSFLPNDPPPGIVFVLGTRPDDTLRPLELLKPKYEYKLPNLSRQDFDLILHHRKVTLTLGLADRFYEAMQENALYLDLVAKELATVGAAPAEEIISRVADNPDNLFSLSTDRLKKNRVEWREVIKPLLGTLLVAQEPLTLRHLRQLLDVEYDQIRDGLRKLGGLVGEDGQGRRYLYHLKFRDYLRQDRSKPSKEYIFAEDEEETRHKRLVGWCEQGGLASIWQNCPRDETEHGRHEYARQHYLRHLYAAREWEKLWEVLDAGEYGLAKIKYDPGMRLYSQDLDLGRDSAMLPDLSYEEGLALLPRLWHYSLLRCSLASQADNYPLGAFELLVKLGRKHEALGLAEILTNSATRAVVLKCLGLEIGKQPGLTQAGELLVLRALEVARQAEADSLIRSLTELLAGLNLAIPEIANRLMELVHSLSFPSRRAYALQTVVQGMVEQHLWEEALATARAIEASRSRAEALQTVVQGMVEQHLWEEALATARAIEDSGSRAYALQKVASGLHASGQSSQASLILQEALATARVVEDSRSRAYALQTVVQGMVEQHLWEEALATARAIEDSGSRAYALQTVVQGMAEQHLWEEALATARVIEDSGSRAEALQNIVNHLSKSELKEQYLKVIQDAWRQATARDELFQLLRECQ
jgi:hypothetical protein